MEYIDLSWNFDTVAVCNCGRKLLPLPSTWDSDGCGWVCVDENCGDYGGGEIYADSLQAVGVPEWVAELIELMFDQYRTRLGE